MSCGCIPCDVLSAMNVYNEIKKKTTVFNGTITPRMLHTADRDCRCNSWLKLHVKSAYDSRTLLKQVNEMQKCKDAAHTLISAAETKIAVEEKAIS